MGANKPKMEVRRPPLTNQADPSKVAAFIDGGDVETSGSPDRQPADRERVQTTVYLDTAVKRRLKAFCNLEDREMSAFVNELVAAELADWTPDF